MDNAKLQQIHGLYYFGAFRLDAAERRLWCADEPISLTPKQFDLLFYFVENAGRVTKKSELLDAVWADTYIEESTLARNVSWLRNKLGECADGEPLIETVPKLGYRFTPEVTRPEYNGNASLLKNKPFSIFAAKKLLQLTTLLRKEVEKMRKGEKKKEKIKLSFFQRSLLLPYFSPVSRSSRSPESALLFIKTFS